MIFEIIVTIAILLMMFPIRNKIIQLEGMIAELKDKVSVQHEVISNVIRTQKESGDHQRGGLR